MTDPTRPGGGIAGPGGPHDRGAVIINTERAVLLADIDVAVIDNESDHRELIAMQLDGRINRTTEQTSILYVFDTDGAAAIVTELIGLAHRAGGEILREFTQLVDQRLADLPDQDKS